MLAMDRDGNGLLEYPCSGNSDPLRRPNDNVSNWWDDIGFGHEDAYGNALAYRALRQTADVADSIGKREDAARYRAAAEKLRNAYYKTFYNPATGILAGWRSADGQLHDYWFLWVNGAAIHYGLVPKDKANAIMDRLMAKMKEVGFTRFDLGLPGNLAPVAMKDYRDLRARFGGGAKADGSEGFQHYENGGATACFAYFTLAALYDLGRQRRSRPHLAADAGGLRPKRFRGTRPGDQPVEGLEVLGRSSLRVRRIPGRQLLCSVGGRGSRQSAARPVAPALSPHNEDHLAGVVHHPRQFGQEAMFNWHRDRGWGRRE